MFGPLLLPLPFPRGQYELRAAYFDVPVGFRTDGASVPRILWPVLGSPFEPSLIGAALVHDQAYQFGAPPRQEADRLFHDMLRAACVGRVRAWCLWAGVRAFGWMYWRRCRYGRGLAG